MTSNRRKRTPLTLVSLGSLGLSFATVTHLGPFSKSKFNLKSDRVNLDAPASHIVSALFTQCPGDTVQTEPGKVDPARKFKCTTAARVDALEPKNVYYVGFKG